MKLGKLDVELRVPASLAERWDIALLATRPGCEHKAYQAALGLCVDRVNRRKRYTGDALAYAALVTDFLLAEGVPMREILAVGGAAYQLCLEDLAPVENAVDFSEPPADPVGG